jgi:hypothetical protein
MLLLEGDKLSSLFGKDKGELPQTIEASFGVKFTVEDIVCEVDIRRLAGRVHKKL